MVSNDKETRKADAEIVNPSTGEITKRPFSDDELRNIESLDSLRALLGDKIGQATDLGSGFAVLDSDDKRRLVGVPLMFVFWTFNDGDNGEFVSAHVVQFDRAGKINGKFIINDGSTGILAQLKEYSERTGSQRGLFVEKGLRASDYRVEIDGKEQPATTFYIDTTPAA